MLAVRVMSESSKDLWSIALEEKDRNEQERRKGDLVNLLHIRAQNAHIIYSTILNCASQGDYGVVHTHTYTHTHTHAVKKCLLTIL